MRGTRRPVAGLVVSLTLGVLTGCDLAGESQAPGSAAASPSSSPTASESPSAPATDEDDFEATDEDHDAIEALMDERAAAVTAGRARDFLATVDPSQPRLRAAQRTLFENLVALPLASLEYDVAEVYLTPARVPGDDPVLHPRCSSSSACKASPTGRSATSWT